MQCFSTLGDNCLLSGVLGHLSVLEDRARKLKTPPQSRLMELKDKVKALKIQRDQLMIELEMHEVTQRHNSA